MARYEVHLSPIFIHIKVIASKLENAESLAEIYFRKLQKAASEYDISLDSNETYEPEGLPNNRLGRKRFLIKFDGFADITVEACDEESAKEVALNNYYTFSNSAKDPNIIFYHEEVETVKEANLKTQSDGQPTGGNYLDENRMDYDEVRQIAHDPYTTETFDSPHRGKEPKLEREDKRKRIGPSMVDDAPRREDPGFDAGNAFDNSRPETGEAEAYIQIVYDY
jgi:hypothetical protein